MPPAYGRWFLTEMLLKRKVFGHRMKNICWRIFLEILPLLVGVLLTYFFWHNNLLLAFLYLCAIGVVLWIRVDPGDYHSLALGLLIGLIVEITGTSVSGYQSFTNPDFLGIPAWLPIAWAYGLMAMKRIGVLVYRSRK